MAREDRASEEFAPCRVYFAAPSHQRASSTSEAREAVPDARDGEDVARLGRVGLDLAAQVANVDVDHPGLDGVLVAPYRAEDPLAGEHLPCVGGQIREEIELGVREDDVAIGAGHAPLRGVDDQVAEDKASVGGLVVTAQLLGSAQLRADTRQQLA